jgi:hypothetical protein
LPRKCEALSSNPSTTKKKKEALLNWSMAQPIVPSTLEAEVGSQEDHEFEASLGYIVRSCLKKTKPKEDVLYFYCV